jgi:exodeoxyribonuclease VII large subunit
VADLRCSTPTQAAVRLTSDIEEQHHQLDQFGHRLRAALRRRAESAAARLAAVARHRFFTRPGEVIDVHRRQLETKRLALRTALREAVHRARRRVDGCDRRLSQLAPMARLRAARQTLDAQQRSLQHGLRRLTADAGRRLPRQGEMLRAAMNRRLDRQRERLEALARQLQAVSPTAILDRGYSVTTDEEGRVIRSTGDVAEGQAIRTRVADGEFDSEVTGGGDGKAKPAPRKPAPRKSARPAGESQDQPGLF